jgi:Cu2+-exporting ATPase
MCCRGCEAVARAIVSGGLESFYRYRTEDAPQGQDLVPEFLREIQVYDNPQIQKRFVTAGEGALKEASLILEGITCAACVWLNEQHLLALPGVEAVQINYATQRAQLRWDDSRIHLSEILEAIARIGYRAHPYDPQRQHELLETQRRRQLRRLGLAGALGMQIMILAVALYFGDWTGMEARYRSFFQWISLGLATPIVLFAAQPFYTSAWRDLRQGRAGMDVPVSLGILGAFAASVWATLTGTGHVYYDSVAMFTFFLLGARYLELAGRRRAAAAMDRLVRVTPAIATRMRRRGDALREESVPVVELQPGDELLVRPGETVPTDGVILKGRSSIDESLLSGESLPVVKGPGDALVGGSINVEGPLSVRVDKVGQDTVLSHILRLLERAQTEKPAITQMADRAASWFVLAVLILAAMVAGYWWSEEPQRWLEITIAVLVVTCPCALSLATPTAITAATGTLSTLGLLTTRGHTLEGLARATHIVFDKTGTLTQGRVRLLRTHRFSDLDRRRTLQVAAALEHHSEHPIARALVEAAERLTATASQVHNTPGYGLKGLVGGTEYFLGTPRFIARHCGAVAGGARIRPILERGNTVVVLAQRGILHAVFELGDEPRPDASQLVRRLRALGLKVLLLSGDHPRAVQVAAQRIGIDPGSAAGGLSPEEKLKKVRELQSRGAVVAMVGDGVNDAPVLAGAQVSIAMGSGAQVALASADMIMLSNRLMGLRTALGLARKTRRIIRQNLVWALTYNALALPAAAMGLVAPWMAAIGMSASSLAVVANALRLTGYRPQPPRGG